MDDVTKTGNCDSCGQDKVLYATPHSQANNPKLFWYCDVCKFAHDKEKRVQVALRAIAAVDPVTADDPLVLSGLHEQAARELLLKKAQDEKLAPNETLVNEEKKEEATTPEVVEGEVVSE